MRWRWPLLTMFALCASGCVGYTGSARDATPEVLRERGWISVRDMALLRQRADHDCGPTALAMVVRHYRPALAVERITRGFVEDRRASAAELRDRARELGLDAYVIEGTVQDLAHELEQHRPVIVGMAKPTATGAVSHYEVVVEIQPRTQRILTLDPAVGWQENSLLGFMKEWVSTGSVSIIVLPLAPPAAVRAGPHLRQAGTRRPSAGRASTCRKSTTTGTATAATTCRAPTGSPPESSVRAASPARRDAVISSRPSVGTVRRAAATDTTRKKPDRATKQPITRRRHGQQVCITIVKDERRPRPSTLELELLRGPAARGAPRDRDSDPQAA